MTPGSDKTMTVLRGRVGCGVGRDPEDMYGRGMSNTVQGVEPSIESMLSRWRKLILGAFLGYSVIVRSLLLSFAATRDLRRMIVYRPTINC